MPGWLFWAENDLVEMAFVQEDSGLHQCQLEGSWSGGEGKVLLSGVLQEKRA